MHRSQRARVGQPQQLVAQLARHRPIPLPCPTRRRATPPSSWPAFAPSSLPPPPWRWPALSGRTAEPASAGGDASERRSPSAIGSIASHNTAVPLYCPAQPCCDAARLHGGAPAGGAVARETQHCHLASCSVGHLAHATPLLPFILPTRLTASSVPSSSAFILSFVSGFFCTCSPAGSLAFVLHATRHFVCVRARACETFQGLAKPTSLGVCGLMQVQPGCKPSGGSRNSSDNITTWVLSHRG